MESKDLDKKTTIEMDKESLEIGALSIALPVSGTVIKEPELVTIIEGMPLTKEQIEEEQDALEEVKGDFEIDESTPLLYSSIETGLEKSDSSFFTYNSKSFTTTFTTSQASLFIPSFQFSLYSSAVCVSGSGASMKDRGGSSKSKSLSSSIFQKLSQDGQASIILALWNMINMTFSSTGAVAMPYAILLGGFEALLLILVVGVFDAITSVLLIDCLYEVCPKTRLRKRVRASYAEIGAEVWGPSGGHLVDIMTVGLSYSSCVLFVMALGGSMKDLFSDLVVLSLQEWCLFCTIALLLVVFIKKLSVLAWLSMLAVMAVLMITLIALGVSLVNLQSWKLSNVPPFDPNSFPISLGIILFSYCGHTVFPGIEGSMKQPKKYKKVSNWAFFSATTLKFLIGLFCILTFGHDTQPIIILNLSLSHASILSKIATALVVVNVYFSYPLNFFVVTGILDMVLLPKFPTCYKNKHHNFFWVVITRVTLVFSTLGIALAVPHFGLLMGIFGSVFGVCLTLVFPCLFHLQLKWKKLRWYQKAFEIFMALFGIIAGILGVSYSSIALKNSLK